MPGRGLALAGRLRRWPELLAVLALLGVVFALREAIDEPGVGVSLLYVLPILFASYWFGAEAGFATGAVAAALYALGGGDNLLLGTLERLVLFTAVGYGIGWLFDQRATLTAAVALQRLELGELRAIQEALVPPEVPERPGLELASCYVPAQEGVAGDFFIVAAGPADATIIVVGDVLGKGIDAARRASFVRTALATFAPFSDDPVRLLDMANYSLIEKAGTSATFVTAACVTFRPADRAASVALAGHPPPLELDTGRPLDARPGVPLGVEVDVGASLTTVPLAPGGGLLLYTDGLIEARLPEGSDDREHFGMERLQRTVAALRGEPPGRLVTQLRTAAEEFAGGALDDDLCMVAMRTRR